jgi:hypothetical protein
MEKKKETIFWRQEGHGSPIVPVGAVPSDYADRIVDAIGDAGLHGGRAETVTVIAVDPAVYAQHEEPRGKAKPICEWQQFPSAMALSMHLGYAYNAVAQALSASSRALTAKAIEQFGFQHTQRIRPEGDLRGATFQYEKDVRDV